MSRTIAREIPGNDWRVWPDEVRRDGWPALFGISESALRLHVDVGFGNGEFLMELARCDPGRAVVGIELSFKRVLKVARRLARTELRNVRLLGVDAAWAAREAFEEHSVETFWINFPDPWPKRRHRHRRFVAPDFVADLARRLTIGGALHVATDDPGYAASIRAALDGEPSLENALAPSARPEARREMRPTAFERQWTEQGRPCFYFERRRAKALAPSPAAAAARAASS